MRETFENATLKLTEFIDSINITTLEKHQNTSKSDFIMKWDGMDWDGSVTQQLIQVNFTQINYLTAFGRCYTFNVPNEISKLNIKDIEIRIKDISAIVYTHHPGQFWRADTNSKIDVKKGNFKEPSICKSIFNPFRF